MISIGIHVAQSQLFDHNQLAQRQSAILSVIIFLGASSIVLVLRNELGLFGCPICPN